jgi:hypothetical protein
MAIEQLENDLSVYLTDDANIDIALSCELLNFGVFLLDDTLLSKSKFLMEIQHDIKDLYILFYRA